jgi:hypothetical protein
MLVCPFQQAQIEEAISETKGNKSPGPDGFNFVLVKSFWISFKDEVQIMIDQFHGTKRLPKSFSSYFVTLIPKVISPFTLGDFLLLARVMNRLMEPTESAFLKGRNLVGRVVVVNEIVD